MMFAPSALITERNLVVVAETVDGRTVDPVRAAASDSDVPSPDRLVIQPGHDVYWASYMQRIKERGIYHRPLGDWIMAHHERTGNPNDKVTHFVAMLIEQQSPPPGEFDPSNIKTTKFLEGP
jgi:hypothetical protein